jgi:hypothetical protein
LPDHPPTWCKRHPYHLPATEVCYFWSSADRFDNSLSGGETFDSRWRPLLGASDILVISRQRGCILLVVDETDLTAPLVEARCSTCGGGSGDSLSSVATRHVLASISSARGAGALGAAATKTSMVGVVVCTVDRRWRPPCSSMGLACGGTALHGGGREGA